MKRVILYIFLVTLISTDFIRGGVPDKTPCSLENLFSRLKSANEDSIRISINDSIKVIIENYIQSDSVFKHTFRDVKYLGQIISSDSRIKIITWNMLLNNNNGWYFCYFIKKGLKGSKNSVYRLEKKYIIEPILSDTSYTVAEWYGALYYDIKPIMSNGKPCWILLGINLSDPLNTRKIIDVLSFTPDNTLELGLKWFKNGNGIYFRQVLEYSSSGVVSLRFANSKTIVFDHLVPIPSLVNEGRVLYGSDYSFDAYIFKDGLWNLTLNFDVRNRK